MCSVFCARILKNRVVHICLKVIFSNIGLCCLVTLYCVGGAALFQRTEGRVERARKKAVLDAVVEVEYRQETFKRQVMVFLSDCQKFHDNRATTSTITSVNATGDNCEESNAIKFLAKLFDDYKLFVIKKKQETGGDYKGLVPDKDTTTLVDWSLASSILFTASILGTIGTRFFLQVYRAVCSLSRVSGYGHVTPKTEGGQLAVILYAVFAIPLMSMFLYNVGNQLGDGIRWLYKKLHCCPSKQKEQNGKQWASRVAPTPADLQQQPKQSQAAQNVITKARSPYAPKSAEDTEDMPILLIMCCGIIYIVLGMVVFHFTERWTMVESLYFTFVSLATIGFGDYVNA